MNNQKRYLNYDELEEIKASLKRCLADPNFLDIFYKNFMSASVQIAEKFKNTNFAYQKIMLKSSLHIMTAMAMGGMQQSDALNKLATLHDRRHRNIKPEWYEDWLDALIKAINATDPLYSARAELLWRDAMRPGIEYMQSKY